MLKIVKSKREMKVRVARITVLTNLIYILGVI